MFESAALSALLVRVHAILVVGWLLAGSQIGPARADEPAGAVSRAAGETWAQREGNPPRPLLRDDPVFAGEALVTGSNGRLEVKLRDGGVLTLGADSRLVIDSYVFDADAARGGAFFSLTDGVFRAAAGILGSGDSGQFEVATRVATIGIRGTSFWGGLKPDRLDVVLLEGKGIYVRSPAGRVDILTTGVGVTIRPDDPAPPRPYRWTPAAIARASATVDFE